jgi:peroxiredoxin
MFKKILTALIFIFLTAFLATGYAAEKKARDFKLCDLDNNRVSLESLLGKGPVYIALWATWCKPCIKELEIVSRMYEEYKDRGFLLVGINEDSGRSYSKVKSFVKAKGWTFPILLDSDEKVKRDYRAFGLPYSVILDPEGNIIHTAYGFRPGDESKVIELIEPFLTKPEEQEENSSDLHSLKKN